MIGRVQASMLALGVMVAMASPLPAAAQQVLVCKTLHNDLWNFDRRAFTADRYQDEIDQARRDGAASDSTAAVNCAIGNIFAVNCDQRARNAEIHRTGVDRMVAIHLQSRLGGSDPVRLRIIAAMRRNGCLPPRGFPNDGSNYPLDPRTPPPEAQPVIYPSNVVRAKG